MIEFKFLAQTKSVESLLQACWNAMPHLPEAEKSQMVQALRRFEEATAPTIWSIDDVDAEDDYNLTDEEKGDVLSRLAVRCRNGSASGDNITDQIADLVSMVAAERGPLFIKVIYDETYTSGAYHGKGTTVRIPLELVKSLADEAIEEDGVGPAFTETTKLDRCHIVYYNLDEIYNEHNELL